MACPDGQEVDISLINTRLNEQEKDISNLADRVSELEIIEVEKISKGRTAVEIVHTICWFAFIAFLIAMVCS